MEILLQSKTSKQNKYTNFGYFRHNNIYAKLGILSIPDIINIILDNIIINVIQHYIARN